jgi:hypothetical protein
VPEAVQRIRDFAPTLTDAALLTEILHVAVNLADPAAQGPTTPGPADTSA